MRQKINFVILTVLIAFTLNEIAFSQIDKSSYYNRGQKFYYNYFYEPADNGDSIKVITIYKIAYDLLKFTKIDKPGFDEQYIAYPTFEVHFQDEEGIIRKRDKKKDTIIINDYALINSIRHFYYGAVVTKLSFQEYSPYVYLWDEDMDKLGEKKLPKFDLRNFTTKIGISSPLICYATDKTDTAHIKPYILDRNASFSSKDLLFYFLTTNTNPDKIYSASIEFLDADRSSINWEGPTRINLHTETYYDKVITFINKKNERPVFKLTVGNPSDKGYGGILKITFTADRTAPGNYKLRIWDNTENDTLEFKFKIIWEDIPYTLRNPKYAADIMYYVLTDEEYDEIKSGSDREILHKIFEWWRKHDPTRFTLYNEAMAEYFNRADYAFFNFKTIYEKDGAKTDRGKIYILYGAPDDVKNTMNEKGEAQEIWIYHKLKKQFTFETDKTDIIYLKEIKDL